MKLPNHNIFSGFEEAKSALILAAAVLLVSATGSLQLFGASSSSETANAAYAGLLVSRVTAEDLKEALESRKDLLKHSVNVTYFTGTGTTVTESVMALADHESWVKLSLDLSGNLGATVDTNRIEDDLKTLEIEGLPSVKNCSIEREYSDAQGVRRIETDCMSEKGYSFEAAIAAKLLKSAFESESPSVSIPVTEESPSILGSTGSGSIVKETLTLLASGESNFKGSGAGRKDNVRKAINEHISNIVIPQGETFSFNSALGDRVTLSRGWKMALTIFGGGELRPSPGGGICQASTTLFRAALRAGLPILEHKSHSLYVTYYEKHGVGLDATIFMGHQDMIFKNDTPGPIVIQSRTIGDDAIVNIFGVDDGRTVDISGPFFAGRTEQTITSNGHRVRSNEIAWERTVSMPSGTEEQEVFLARYKTLPLSLSRKYTASTIRTRGNTETALTKVVADNR